MGVAGLLVLASLVGVPYVGARALWRIPVPCAARGVIAAAVPIALAVWLGTSVDFRDITELGAAFIPLVVIFGWLLGTTGAFRRHFVGRFG